MNKNLLIVLFVFFISLFIIAPVFADENITINNSYFYNQTFVYNYTINQTINNTYWINQTNLNLTCINCTLNQTYFNYTTLNQTNVTCINCSYINNTYYNNTGNLGNYYDKNDIDSKIASLNYKIDNFPTNATNTTSVINNEGWQGRDTFFLIGIIFVFLISVIAIVKSLFKGEG